MKALTKYLLAAFMLGYYVGCAKKKFIVDDAKINETCQAALGCTHVGGSDFFNYTTTVSGGQVDILFVDDNSASMSFEQSHMAERLSSLLDTLDAKSIDYRIGITTTDISGTDNPPRAINQNGALQDGHLIQFADGSYFLTPQSGTAVQRVQWFSAAIQRGETKQCENFINSNSGSALDSGYQANCPSGDERGIYAANLFVTNNYQSMIRPQAALSVVVLSDEDVRSSLYYRTNSMMISDLDLPQTLVAKVKALYPDKAFAAHSIIVRPGQLTVSTDQMNKVLADLTYDPINAGYDPAAYFGAGADSACLQTQSQQMPGKNILGSYGYFYAVLTRMTGGIEGDICANNYASQLSDIGAKITESVQSISLRCSSPSNLTVDISPVISGLTHELLGSTLKFSQVLPVGTKVSLTYSCPSAF